MRSSCARRDSRPRMRFGAKVIVLGYASVTRGPPLGDTRGTQLRELLYEHREAALFAGRKFSGGSGGGGNKFVVLDFCGDAEAAVGARFHPYHLSAAANVHVTRLRHLLRKGQHELKLAAHFKRRVGQKIQTAIDRKSVV